MEQDRGPRLAQVPLDIVTEHAEKHVGADPRLDPVVHRPDLQIDRFHGEKRLLYPREILVGSDGVFGAHRVPWHAGASNVEPIEPGLARDAVELAVVGEAVSGDARSFPGRYTLIYFGYTHCRDVCPTTLAELAGALDVLGRKADLIQPLFVALDPERDTPLVLQIRLASLSPRLLGLTGTPEQISAIAHAYRASSIVHPAAAGGYDVDLGSRCVGANGCNETAGWVHQVQHRGMLPATAFGTQAGRGNTAICSAFPVGGPPPTAP
jgi:hypothetical protein